MVANKRVTQTNLVCDRQHHFLLLGRKEAIGQGLGKHSCKGTVVPYSEES